MFVCLITQWVIYRNSSGSCIAVTSHPLCLLLFIVTATRRYTIRRIFSTAWTMMLQPRRERRTCWIAKPKLSVSHLFWTSEKICLKIVMIGSWRKKKKKPLPCHTSASVFYCVSLTEVTEILALRNLAVHFTSEINIFFIVLFISQLLVEGLFSCQSFVFGYFTVMWSAESVPVFLFWTVLRLWKQIFLPLSFYKSY